MTTKEGWKIKRFVSLEERNGIPGAVVQWKSTWVPFEDIKDLSRSNEGILNYLKGLEDSAVGQTSIANQPTTASSNTRTNGPLVQGRHEVPSVGRRNGAARRLQRVNARAARALGALPAGSSINQQNPDEQVPQLPAAVNEEIVPGIIKPAPTPTSEEVSPEGAFR